MQEYRPTQTLDKVQNSSAASATLTLAITTIVLWVIDTYTDADLPVSVQVALATLIGAAVGGVTYLVGYMTSLKAHEIEPIITPETERRGPVV